MADKQEVQQAQQAAEQAAEQTAESVVQEGGSQHEAQQAARVAAEQAAESVAPELTDAQIKRIADESGKAAARETIEEMRKLGAIREETDDLSQQTAPPPNQGQQTEQVQQQQSPPPREPTPQETEIQQEVPRKLSLAEKFIGKK